MILKTKQSKITTFFSNKIKVIVDGKIKKILFLNIYCLFSILKPKKIQLTINKKNLRQGNFFTKMFD